MKSLIKHTLFILLALSLFLILPFLIYGDVSALISLNKADAVSSASVELPEQPSGEFVVLLNTKKLSEIKQWEDFFAGRDAGVIMEDISCTAINTDPTGIQLAKRYQARLAENQMKLRTENALLLASKAEYGLYDAVVMSAEMAGAYNLETVYESDGTEIIRVLGE